MLQVVVQVPQAVDQVLQAVVLQAAVPQEVVLQEAVLQEVVPQVQVLQAVVPQEAVPQEVVLQVAQLHQSQLCSLITPAFPQDQVQSQLMVPVTQCQQPPKEIPPLQTSFHQ